MNVSCGSCPAKYAVPDDKVRGRKVRIKCKRCGSPILVDGTSLGEQPGPAAPDEQPAAVGSGLGARGLSAGPQAAGSGAGGPGAGDASSGQRERSPPADPHPPVAQAVSGKRTMLGVPAPATLSSGAPLFGTPRPAQATVTRAFAEAKAGPQPQQAETNTQPLARKQTMLGGMRAPRLAVAAAEALPAPVDEEPPWTIAINDEQQVEASLDEMVELYRTGTIDAETFIWRDGMADWSTPFEIPEVAGALEAAGFGPEPGPRPDESNDYAGDDPEEATHVVVGLRQGLGASSDPSRGWHEPAALEPRRPTQGSVSFEDETVTMQESQAEDLMRLAAARDSSQAARRAQAPSQDLFGNLERAGSEEEATEEPEPSPELHPDASRKLTGARNESSVLFSLDALTKMAEPPERSAPDASFLETKTSPSERAPDSLINVGAGGLSGSPLAAPDFNVPVAPAAVSLSPASVPDLAAFAPRRSWGKIVLLVLVVLIVAAAALGYVFKQPAALFALIYEAPGVSSDDTRGASEGTPEPPSNPTSAATAESETTSDSAGAASRAAVDQPAPDAAARATNESPRTEEKPPAAPVAPARPEPASDPEPAPEPASAAPPFDRNAAAAALGSAAGSVASCKSASGPTGSGKAIVTFSQSGRVTTATVTGDFAGTQVGGCVARLFRNTKIPAFSGDSVTVSKSFSID